MVIMSLVVACGGCFSPPDVVTTVDGHRMVISLSPAETVLWDQIVYSGAPEDFVWVLPVPSELVKIELAEAAFFEQIDAATAPTVTPASPSPCAAAQAASCGGCGEATSADSADDDPSDGVTVFDHSVVGPYETVTLGSEDPDALYDWLSTRGYAVPESTVPTLEFYIDKQSVFVVMRLAPGEGVDAMQPVRVRYPGYMATFPLAMVVVGAYGVLDLALWVIAEQRYEARNYGTVRIDETQLSWDWATNRSNYGELFDAAVLAGNSRAWVVEHASSLEQVYLGGDADADEAVARLHQPYPYITRLRTRMLVDHINEDLELAPAEDPTDVPSQLLATIDVNYDEGQCVFTTQPGTCGAANGTAGARRGGWLLLVGLVAAGVVGRRRRRVMVTPAS
jgi:hypothetical protein